MIPPFDDSGYFPSGVHGATLTEILARFRVQSELRRVQMESVRSMVDLTVHAGAQPGSFSFRLFVTPAHAGVQRRRGLDSGFRRSDG